MLNILIIEDNASDFKLMASLLERKNYNVFHAGDWYAGQQLIAERQYHLILLDWELPQISGIDVLATIKMMPEKKNIPVIFVTGRNEGKYPKRTG